MKLGQFYGYAVFRPDLTAIATTESIPWWRKAWYELQEFLRYFVIFAALATSYMLLIIALKSIG